MSQTDEYIACGKLASMPPNALAERIKGLQVTEYQPTAPMDLEPLGPPAVGQMRKASWLQQLDRIERKLDTLIKALAEEEEPQGTLDESGPVDPGKVQGL